MEEKSAAGFGLDSRPLQNGNYVNECTVLSRQDCSKTVNEHIKIQDTQSSSLGCFTVRFKYFLIVPTLDSSTDQGENLQTVERTM